MQLTLKEIGKLVGIGILFIGGTALIVLVTGGVGLPVIGLAVTGMIGAGALSGSIILGVDLHHTIQRTVLEKDNVELIRQKAHHKSIIATLHKTAQTFKTQAEESNSSLAETKKLNRENAKRIEKLAGLNNELERDNQKLTRQCLDLKEACARHGLVIVSDDQQNDEKKPLQISSLDFKEDVPFVVFDEKDEIASMFYETKNPLRDWARIAYSEVSSQRMFLKHLKLDVDDKKWDKEGVGFFGYKTPDTIEKLRKELDEHAKKDLSLDKGLSHFLKVCRQICVDSSAAKAFVQKYHDYFEKIGAILTEKASKDRDKDEEKLNLQQRYYRIWCESFMECSKRQKTNVQIEKSVSKLKSGAS